MNIAKVRLTESERAFLMQAPTSDVKLRLTVYSGHLGFGSPVLAKAQMRHFDVGTLAIETIVGRGFRACKVRAYSPGRSECSERRPG